MKLLIISDSHGNIANLKHVVGFAKTIKAGAVVHCGDWDNKESVDTVLSFGIPLYTILGNADIDHEIEDTLKFQAKKFEPDILKFEIDGRKIGVIHQMTKDIMPKFESTNIVFSGHYHSKEEKEINFTKFVRPGAIINGNNFAVYETANNRVEFFADV